MIRLTALSDVRVYVNVVGSEAVQLGSIIARKPTNTLTWISLRAGQSREDISLIIGIDPHILPNEPKQLIGRNMYAVGCQFDPTQDKEAEFYGVLKAEAI